MLMTGKEYLDSIRDGRHVYIGGEVVESGPKRTLMASLSPLCFRGYRKFSRRRVPLRARSWSRFGVIE
jgi:hypothetical protein